MEVIKQNDEIEKRSKWKEMMRVQIVCEMKRDIKDEKNFTRAALRNRK